jgi:hypothetical protein
MDLCAAGLREDAFFQGEICFVCVVSRVKSEER